MFVPRPVLVSEPDSQIWVGLSLRTLRTPGQYHLCSDNHSSLRRVWQPRPSSPWGLPRSSSTKWLKERPQVSSEYVHYIVSFCGNLFPSGLQGSSSGKGSHTVVVWPYQIDFVPQTCDGWPGDRVKKTRAKEIWCTINRNPIWNYVTKSRSLVPRPSSHYSLAICSLVVLTHCTVFGLVQVQKVILLCSVQQATKVTNPWYCKWYCQTLDSGKAWEWNQKSCSYTSVSHGRSTRLQLTHALAAHACSVHAILPTHAVNYVVKLLVCFKWEMKSIWSCLMNCWNGR